MKRSASSPSPPPPELKSIKASEKASSKDHSVNDIDHNHTSNSNGFNLEHNTIEMKQQNLSEKIAILDFGAQYGKVIDRRVRECNVFCDILPFSTSLRELLANSYTGVIISGGPNSVYEDNAPKYDNAIFNGTLPVLGICYGFQLINKVFGGNVSAQKLREDGRTSIQIDPDCPLFEGLSREQMVLLTHGDGIAQENVAPGFKVIASSGNLVAGIASTQKKIYGLQFHPEVDLTDNGIKIFETFLRKIVGLKCLYTIENRESVCIDKIRKTVGSKNVLVMVSGGVDSTVCAALLTKALTPDRIVAIHIDNGFMRLNESNAVVKSLNEVGLDVKRFNSVNEFLDGQFVYNDIETRPLRFVTSPEEKRMIIGDTFIKCKDIAIKELNLDADIFFAQGTLRPDLIESASGLASGCAQVIKTHHNDTELVRRLRDLGKVVEPLQDFHKDEVRELGRALGLPESIVNRHPFPGPGLAIRILCADEPFKEEHFEETQRLIQEISSEMSEDTVKAFLLPIKSVGVQGDRRTYSYVAALSIDSSPDKGIPWRLLEHIAVTIPRRVHYINRVVYVFGKTLAQGVQDITITHINEGTLQQLQRADDVVYQVLCGLGEDGKPSQKLKKVIMDIQQMPVVLVPVHFGRAFKPPQTFPPTCRSICLRPFITRDFMTGRAAIPGEDIPEESILEMARRIKTEVPLISRVMIDLTSKPPGTTEWE